MTEEIRPDDQINEEQLDKIAGGVYIGSIDDGFSVGEGYVAPVMTTTTTSTTTAPSTPTTTTPTTTTSPTSTNMSAQLATLRGAVAARASSALNR